VGGTGRAGGDAVAVIRAYPEVDHGGGGVGEQPPQHLAGGRAEAAGPLDVVGAARAEDVGERLLDRVLAQQRQPQLGRQRPGHCRLAAGGSPVTRTYTRRR
jgi:hypothetical protein